MGIVARKRRRCCGLTLIDGLVGIGLILVGALVFASVFPVAGEARSAAEKNTIALSVAERQIEAVRNMPFGSVQTHDFDTPELRDGFGHVEVSDAPGESALKQVVVTVHWFVGNAPKQVTLVTYVTDR